jgi:hypothetical protein
MCGQRLVSKAKGANVLWDLGEQCLLGIGNRKSKFVAGKMSPLDELEMVWLPIDLEF